MANIPLKSIKFPDLADTYTVPSNAGELPYDKSATYPADTVGKALQDKPDADGTIANAEQLTSNIYEEDNTPYNFRTSGGSIDIGDRETDMVVGGTVAWNQMITDSVFLTGSTAGITRTKNNDGTLTISGTATNVFRITDALKTNSQGHKWFVVDANHRVELYTGTASEGIASAEKGGIISQAGSDSMYLYCRENGTDFGNGVIIKPIAIDLTAMFGTAIADYIYTLETANVGAGVAWFRKLFPKPYYAYNAGELMSVNTSAHNTVGFNAWDEETESGGINQQGQKFDSTTKIRPKNYIRVLPSTVYYFNIPNNAIGNGIVFYDADKNFISYTWIGSASTVTTPPNANYMLFDMSSSYGTTYKNDICINLSWDGERDGEYEAYVKHSYPLDSSLTLRGIPKLDASNNLYYDGDTYESDGTVTRKYGIVDLGTLDWYYTSGANSRMYAAVSGIKVAGTYTTVANILCDKYVTTYSNAVYDHTNDKTISVHATLDQVWIYDSAYSDAESFKTAMSGVYLVYELATPTTETADPYTNPQIVNDFGTEEYVDYAVSQGDRDVSIPVGHETQYMANLKAKLEMSPNSPEGAGDYIVRQTNGENEYVTLASNATIQDIIARLEALENAES